MEDVYAAVSELLAVMKLMVVVKLARLCYAAARGGAGSSRRVRPRPRSVQCSAVLSPASAASLAHPTATQAHCQQKSLNKMFLSYKYENYSEISFSIY